MVLVYLSGIAKKIQNFLLSVLEDAKSFFSAKKSMGFATRFEIAYFGKLEITLSLPPIG